MYSSFSLARISHSVWVMKALATAYNPFRHPKSGELKLHEEGRISDSGLTLQQILVQVLLNPGFGKRFRNELPFVGTCRERLGGSGLNSETR